MYKIDYDIERTENCILIDSEGWLSNSSNVIQEYRLSGKKVLTYLTKAIDVNLNGQFLEAVKPQDIVLISRVAAEVAQYRNHKLLDEHKYFDIPVMQVLGKFKGNKVSLDNLTLLFNKVLYKKENVSKGTLEAPDNETTVGKILKIGTNSFSKDWNPVPLKVKVGDTVLIKDNVSTRIVLDGEEYFVTEESSVVCIFKPEDTSLENANFINEVILMSPYIPEKISEHLWTPNMDYENADYTDIYDRNRFRVDYLDTSLTGLGKSDIIWVNRSLTSYVFYKGVRYFLINGKDNIEFKEL